MLTLEQLTTEISEDEALEESLTALRELGFPVTSWQSGGVALTLVRLFSRTWASLSSVVADQTRSGFVGLARGNFATLLARYQYGTERNAPTPTEGLVRLTNDDDSPMYNWDAGEIVFANRENENEPGAVSFEITESGSLSPGESAVFSCISLVPGESGNLPNNESLFLWTALDGVSVEFEVQDNTWISSPGTPQESTSRLQERMRGVLRRQTYSNTDGAYRAWALEALPEMNRVKVSSEQNSLNVSIAGATAAGPLDSSQIEIVEDYINGTDGVGRRPINDIVTVVGASTVTAPALSVRLYVEPEVFSTAEGSAISIINEHLGDYPIGGKNLESQTSGYFLVSELVQKLQTIQGVRSVLLLSPTSDVLLPSDAIYTPSISVEVRRVLS